MYSTPSVNEMTNYQQLLLQQQRQHQQSAQNATAQQHQQLLQQQAMAQAELRSRELNIQSATSHQQVNPSQSHATQQSAAIGTSQNSNPFMSHTSSAMYNQNRVHHGSSGGSVISVTPPMTNLSTNVTSHLSSMSNSRSNMMPPSSSSLSRSSSSSLMAPPRSAGNSMLPPLAIPLARGGVKDRRSELQRKRDEDFAQRKRQRENLERKEIEAEKYSKALFDAPVKTTNTSDDSRQVANILGDHSDVAQIINSSTVSCIGIDYQPPTPATPSNHHIIGGEDDEPFTNSNGSIHTDTQNGGINQRRSGQVIHSGSAYPIPRGSYGAPPTVNQYMAKPITQQHNQISPEGQYSGNSSQQLSPHPPHRRTTQALPRAPSHQAKLQNSTQLHNRELISSARLMGTNSHHSSYHGPSPGDPTSLHPSQISQSSHPLENMVRLSNNAISSTAHQRNNFISGSAETPRVTNVTASHGTTAISTFTTNTSSNYSPVLKPRQPSPASLGSSSNSKMKLVSGLPPLNIEAAKDGNRKNEHANSNKNLSKKPSLQAIFDEMAVCPPPLSAMGETPHISEREGNNHRNSAPKYSFGPIIEPPAPLSASSESIDSPFINSNNTKKPLNVVSISGVHGPMLSEDSDSDTGSAMPFGKNIAPQIQHNSNETHGFTSMEENNISTKTIISGNLIPSSKDNTIIKNSETEIASKSTRNSAHANEKDGTSSDSTSNTDTSDSDSSSEEEDNGKQTSKQNIGSSEPTETSMQSAKESSTKSSSKQEINRLAKPNAKTPVSILSPFDSTANNFPSLESKAECDGDPENDADKNDYDLASFYRNVIKSTHSPHSQPSPKISQGSDSVHEGSRPYKADDSPNDSGLLNRHDDDDDNPMLAMLSNTNQHLPDYTGLMSDENHLPNLSGSTSKNGQKTLETDPIRAKDRSSRRKTSKNSTLKSRDKKKSDASRASSEAHYSGSDLEDNHESASGRRKKDKRKRSINTDLNRTYSSENSSVSTHDNEQLVSKVPKTTNGKKRPGPIKAATPRLRLSEQDSDEELGKDLLDIQTSTYNTKQHKKSAPPNPRRKETHQSFLSPSRGAASVAIPSQNDKNKITIHKSPSKGSLRERNNQLPDASIDGLSVSSSSSEEDDQRDQDWTERRPKRLPAGKNSRSPLKSPLRMPKKSPKISPGKNYDKAMSLGRDKSISSSNEDNDNPLRHNKNKGGKASPASGAEKQLAIGALFRKQALQQKKGSDVSKVNERPKKGDENRVTDTTMTKSDRYKSSELEDVSTKRDQSYSDFKDMGTNSSVKLRYRAKTEHPEIRRPVVLCRIPLSNLKNMSQNLSSVFELRECSVTVRPSRQLDSMASLVSPYNQPSHADNVTEENEPKSDRSAEKTRSRSRRDSSTSSKSRRKRNRRHVSRNMNEDSSNSDHDGSAHSSSGSLHAKRRKKEPKETDIDKSAFSNKRTCLLSDEQGSLEDHTSHHVPLNAVENEERALKNNLLSAESNSIALNVHSRVNVQDEQHSNYHDAVEYYGYNENSRNASSLEEVIPTSRSSDNPMPSTSNDTQSHQSIMMPPPNKRFYSYLEHRRTEEDQIDDNEIDPSVYMNQAKTLKHDADKELDKERQAMKYLQAVLYFILFANSSEQRNEKQSAFTLYQETLSLVK